MRRPNPVFSPEYRALVAVLVRARKAAGLSQRQVAARLGRASSHIALIERGQRRVDVLELFLLARALERPPGEIFEAVSQAIDAALPDGGEQQDREKSSWGRP